MIEQKQGIYEFHDFRLDLGKGVLFRENEPLTLQWKTFELLCIFVKSGGNLLTRDELIGELWADTFVEDNNLSQHIRALRKALGDNGNGTKFIETVAGRGYRFLPEVRIVKPAIDIETAFADEQHNQSVHIVDFSEKSTPETGNIVQPATSFQAPVKRIEAKVIAFPAAENSVLLTSKDEAIVEDASEAQPAIGQNADQPPKITRRRRGLQRGIKSLLWAVGIGFGVVVLFQIFQIVGVWMFTSPDYPPSHVKERIEMLLDTMAIPLALGWALAVGLFLFGVIRIIHALFEKEDSKLSASLFEKITAAVIAVVIAAIFIPNMIASYRFAKEAQQTAKSSQNQIKAIAVLPLKSLSSNADDEELRLRLTDALITRLGGLKDIATRPTDSVLRLSKSNSSSLELGKKLQVDAILDGRIQRENDRLRVTLQLISVPGGEPLWAEQFDGEAHQLLDLQDAISAKLLQTLNQSRPQKIEFTARPTQNERAYEAFLKARFFARRTDEKNLLRAIDYYKQALGFDSQFAESYAGMAHAQFQIYVTQNEHKPEILEQGRENIQKAVEIKPDSAVTLNALAYSQTFIDWDWQNAEKTIKRSIDAEPNSFGARMRYGALLTTLRRFEEARIELELANKLDPTSPAALSSLGLLYFCQNDLARAEEQFNKALELDEKHTHALWFLSRCLWMRGKKKEAIEYLVRALKADGDEMLARKIEEKAKTSAPADVIRFVIDAWSKDPNNTDYVSFANRAMQIGEREKALNWLEKSFEQRHPKTIMIASLPDFEPLRSEPRFQVILQKMNLE